MMKRFLSFAQLKVLPLLAIGLSGCEEFDSLQLGFTPRAYVLPSEEPSIGTEGLPQGSPKSATDSWMDTVQAPGPAPSAFSSTTMVEPLATPSTYATESPTPTESPSASPSPSITTEAEFIDPEWVDITQTYTTGTTHVIGELPGDGHDDTAAIQAHLDFAATSNRRVVYFPAGVYHVGSTLNLPTGITLRGSDRMSHVDSSRNSTLIYSGTGPQGVMIDLTALGNSTFQTIEHLHFKGAPGLLYLIRMDMGHSRRIRYNIFEEIPLEAAAIGGGNVMFSYIERNVFRNSDGHPIRLAQNLSRVPAAGYYGNNVGTIAGNLFAGHRGIFVNGIFSILANTFKIDGQDACGVTLGDPALTGGTDFNPANSVQSQITISQNLFQMSGSSVCGIATSSYISTSIRGNKFEGTGTQFGVNASATSRVLLEGNQFTQFAAGIIYRNGSTFPLAWSENKFFRVERPILAWGAAAAPALAPSNLSPDQEIINKTVVFKGAATSASFTQVSGQDPALSLDLRLGQFGFSPRTVVAGTTAAAENGNLFDLEAGARLPASGYQPGAPVIVRTADSGSAAYQIQFTDRQGNLPGSFGAGISVESGAPADAEGTSPPVAGLSDIGTAEMKTAFRLVTVSGCSTTACEVQLDLRNGTVFEITNGTGMATVKLRPPVTTDIKANLANYQGTLFVLGNSRSSRSSMSLSPDIFSSISVSTLAPGEFLLLVVDSTGSIREVTQGGSR